MIYLSFIGMTYMPKNRLQIALQEMLQEEERKVIDPEWLIDYQLAILQNIDDLNKEHSRCKPINATWAKFYALESKDIALRGLECIQFFLYASKETN